MLKFKELAILIKLIVSPREFKPVPIRCLSLYLLSESLFNKLIFSEIEITKQEKIKILINDYFNISKSLITKKELGMINAITDKYINEKKQI